MQEFGISNISLLLTLGTPHIPPPKKSYGVIDQTRGLLDYIEKYCVKPFDTPELRYICVAGRFIQGARIFGANGIDSEIVASTVQSDAEVTIVNTSKPPSTTWRAHFVGQGYKQVCGQAGAWSNGVAPVTSAHLEGDIHDR